MQTDTVRTPDIINNFYWPIFSRVSLLSLVALVFVSGVFRFADVFGIRLFLQIVFSIPIALFFLYKMFQSVDKFFSAIIIYALVKLVLELIWRGNGAYILENGLLIMALFILLSCTGKELSIAVHGIIWIATFFSLLALIQWLVSFLFGDMVNNSMGFTESGELLKGDNNIFSYLGFFSEKQYTVMGHTVARHQSFAKEPSLVLVFFYLTACIAILYNYKKYRVNFWVIILFCVLSFSGSVMMALGLSIPFFLLLGFVNIRFILPTGLIFFMLFYLTYIKNSGLDVILSFFLDLGSRNNLLSKTASITDRALPAVDNWQVVLSSPVGQGQLSEASGPWLVNSGLATGWIGITALVFFLFGLAREMHKLQLGRLIRDKIGLSLVLGSLAVFIIFNDYQMNSYSGLLLITLLYRVFVYRNKTAKMVRPAPSVVAGLNINV